MADFVRVDAATVTTFSEEAAHVLAHLCEGDCLTYGTVVSWCESRFDCVHTVTCPTCKMVFHLDDADLDALERWTDSHGGALVCGVSPQVT